MIKLSKPGKMPCKSWSLQALETCAGSRDKNGDLVDPCIGCYAQDGNYRFPNVKAPRIHNKTDWKRPEWVSDMVAAIKKESHFRWFDSGDVYSVKLAEKIRQVMEQTPATKHWLPTRMHKFPKFRATFDAMHKLENVAVRYSSDSIHGETIAGELTSTIFDPEDINQVPDGANICPAYQQDGKCMDCRLCWDKSNTVTAYPQHGRKMAALNRRLQVNIK